jgi:hypothetical protein
MNIRYPTLFLLATILCSCGLGFYYEKHLVGKYWLIGTDSLEQVTVRELLKSGGALGVIDRTVFAAGANADFIIAAQHPFNTNHDFKVDRSTTNYFILQVKSGHVTGPLSYSDFIHTRHQMKLPDDLDFTILIDEMK